jgi:hypothetical protein
MAILKPADMHQTVLMHTYVHIDPKAVALAAISGILQLGTQCR